jgi:hypothetical protein
MTIKWVSAEWEKQKGYTRTVQFSFFNGYGFDPHKFQRHEDS